MKISNVDLRDRQMLDLLSKGASTETIARKMGYSSGTVRVYLHNLYRKLGVKNRTEAVIRHLNEARAAEARASEPRAVIATPAFPQSGQDTFGDAALKDGLFCALGVMESFLGPYSRVWEVGQRLRGSAIDEKAAARRANARFLWRALVNEDWAAGKRLYDEGTAERLAGEGAADAQLLVCLLLIGGYSSAGEQVLAHLLGRRKGSGGTHGREARLLRSLREALYAQDEAGVAALHALAEATPTSPLKQTAMVALYYAYKARKDPDRARATANAIWAEADAARRQLEAVGVRPLDRDAVLPDSGKPAARRKAAEREKVAAVR